MVHSSEWQRSLWSGPSGSCFKPLSACKNPLCLHPYLCQYLRSSCSWNTVQEHLARLSQMTGFARYKESCESWSALHRMHVLLMLCIKKLHIAAVWGELGSLTPSSRARLNAVRTGSIIPSSTCYCPHCPPGSRAVFSRSWLTPLVNLWNNLLKASFLHWAHGFRQPRRPLGHLDVDSCLWILFYVANPWGK